MQVGLVWNSDICRLYTHLKSSLNFVNPMGLPQFLAKRVEVKVLRMILEMSISLRCFHKDTHYTQIVTLLSK